MVPSASPVKFATVFGARSSNSWMLKLPSVVVKCAIDIVYALLNAILPVSAVRRLHVDALRRQSAGRLYRWARADDRHDAGDCEGDELLGVDVRAAARAAGHGLPPADLHAGCGAPDGGTPGHRHGVRAGAQ